MTSKMQRRRMQTANHQPAFKQLTTNRPSNNSHTIKTMHAQAHHHVQRSQHLQTMSKPLIQHRYTKSIPRVQTLEHFGQGVQQTPDVR